MPARQGLTAENYRSVSEDEFYRQLEGPTRVGAARRGRTRGGLLDGRWQRERQYLMNRTARFAQRQERRKTPISSDIAHHGAEPVRHAPFFQKERMKPFPTAARTGCMPISGRRSGWSPSEGRRPGSDGCCTDASRTGVPGSADTVAEGIRTGIPRFRGNGDRQGSIFR